MRLNIRETLFHWRDKLNKVLQFGHSFFKEIDLEIAKLFTNVGIVIITIFLSVLFAIWYLASIFEKEGTFLVILTLVIIITLNSYAIRLADNSKIRKAIFFLFAIGSLMFVGFILFILSWGIFDFSKDIYSWFIKF